MNYQALILKNQRQAILELLRDQNGYSINAAILQSSLNELGMPASGSVVKGLLVWLAEQDFIKLSTDTVMVATITSSGVDIANGLAQHPDIQRPLP